MSRVLLLSMPFGALERQALGLSLLKARLTQMHVSCDVRYLTFPFAELIGFETYQWLGNELPYTAFAGDWSFCSAVHGENAENDRAYVERVLRATWLLDATAIANLWRVRSMTEPFLNHCMATIPFSAYRVVGFTSTFEQNLASLALAKRIKREHPDVAIVFGGANWEGAMGEELHRQYTFVDYVCSGESELSFPELAARLVREKEPAEPDAPIPGTVYRSGASSISVACKAGVEDMNSLPTPDYCDYFHDLEASTVGAFVLPKLLLETARGCWWGAKSQCTFCGLNGGSMRFRSKSPERALEELDELVARWRVNDVEVVDNILDMKYFGSLLPALAERAERPSIFYEVKANLSRKQIAALKRAGVDRIQPGIESMSSRILKMMRKGTSALQNIQLLKWCRVYGVEAAWNVLYGFPGELRADYDLMLQLFESIRHLQAPGAVGPIRLDRFSPYFERAADYGIRNLRPIESYRYLYPVDEASLARIAYYFDFDYAAEVDPGRAADELIRYVRAWQREPETGTLRTERAPDGALHVIDTRSNASLSRVSLSGLESAAFRYCDEQHSAASVTRHLRSCFPAVQVEESSVRAFLDSLVAHRLAVREGEHYLNVALDDDLSDAPFEAPARLRRALRVVSASV